jgi:molybdopterin-guanine dinucleotide biosynthesis protein A
VRTLATLSDDVIVVANDPARYRALSLPARLLSDERPGQGSLMGIYSGLKAIRHAYAVVVGCDMPFLQPPLLSYLLSLAPGYDVVVPVLRNLLEPLHAVYARSCLPLMDRVLEDGRRQIVAFFPQARIRMVNEQEIDRFDPEHRSFINVNTPQDWEQVQGLLHP